MPEVAPSAQMVCADGATRCPALSACCPRGTGPKAGGPHCLPRFATGQTATVSDAAAGGRIGLVGPEA